jgi:hypothetical protein
MVDLIILLWFYIYAYLFCHFEGEHSNNMSSCLLLLGFLNWAHVFCQCWQLLYDEAHSYTLCCMMTVTYYLYGRFTVVYMPHSSITTTLLCPLLFSPTLLYSYFELVPFFKLCSSSILLLYSLLLILSTLSTLLLFSLLSLLYYSSLYSLFSYYSTTLHLISQLLQLFWIEHIFDPSLSTTTLLCPLLFSPTLHYSYFELVTIF